MLSQLKLRPTKREQVSPYGDKLRTTSKLSLLLSGESRQILRNIQRVLREVGKYLRG